MITNWGHFPELIEIENFVKFSKNQPNTHDRLREVVRLIGVSLVKKLTVTWSLI